MPNTMPGNTMRGKLIEEIEFWIEGSSTADISAVMTDLVNGVSLRNVLSGLLDYPNLPADLNHLDKDWLGKGPGPSWWGNYEVEDITRIGIWSALEHAKGGAPLFITWVCAGAHFEVHVLPSKHQITVLILTPPESQNPAPTPPHPGGPAGPPDTSIIVTRAKMANPGNHGMSRSPLTNTGPQSAKVEIYHPNG